MATNDLHEVDSLPTAVGTGDTTTGFLLLTTAAGWAGGWYGGWQAAVLAVATLVGVGMLWHGTMRRLEWRELLCASVLARAAGVDLDDDDEDLEPFDPEALTGEDVPAREVDR